MTYVVPPRKRGLSIVLGALGVTLLALAVHGEFRAPSDAPVERLVTNVSAYVREHPQEAHGYYVLARLHTLAFALNSAAIKVYENDKRLPTVDLPYAPIAQGQQVESREKLTDEKLAAHMKAALANYHKALELSPGNALYLLGRAYALESGAKIATELPPSAEGGRRDQNTAPADAGKAWLRAAAAGYLDAFRKSIDKDSKLPHLPIQGIEGVISHEAGNALLRLASAGAYAATDAEKQEVEKGLATVKNLKQGEVTPIIFSLEGPQPLRALTSDQSASFDLNGDLQIEEWNWVEPDTCILVWDPQGRGTITSGRQLFGSVTWWMFWADGYHALDALDDNRDGELAGGELCGLAVWRDANSNAISEPGEVVALSDAGIVALAVKASSTAEGCPANLQGVRLRDGRVLPSYDWIAETAKPAISRSTQTLAAR